MLSTLQLERWLTSLEAREQLGGIARSTLYRLIKDGALKVYRVGSTLRFLAEDVTDCQQKQPTRLQRAAKRQSE